MGKQKQPTTTGGRLGLGVLAVLQMVFAFLAFWDLAHRPAEEVVGGRKVTWIPVILINWIGPAVYFLFGTRR